MSDMGKKSSFDDKEADFLQKAADVLDLLNAQPGLTAKLLEFQLYYKGIVNLGFNNRGYMHLDVYYEPQQIRLHPSFNIRGKYDYGLQLLIAQKKGRIFVNVARQDELSILEVDKKKRYYYDNGEGHDAFLECVAKFLYGRALERGYGDPSIKAIYERVSKETKQKIADKSADAHVKPKIQKKGVTL